MARFSIDVRVDGAECDVLVGGDVDSNAADQLFTVGVLAIEKSRAATLILDLADVGVFDSAGVEALIRLRDVCQAQAKDLYLRTVPARLNDLLAGTGLSTLLPE